MKITPADEVIVGEVSEWIDNIEKPVTFLPYEDIQDDQLKEAVQTLNGTIEELYDRIQEVSLILQD